jgi:hypothetical protein
MGNCSSNDAAPVRVPEEAKKRRLVRQNTSSEELRRQLDEYHSKPQQQASWAAKRPGPIAIKDPAGPGSLGSSTHST